MTARYKRKREGIRERARKKEEERNEIHISLKYAHYVLDAKIENAANAVFIVAANYEPPRNL